MHLFQSSKACDAFEIQASRVSNGNYAVDIILKRQLDFESDRSYIMAVKATNVAPPSNFTTKNFVINVLDSQDQLPVFIKAPYSPIPLEEVPVVRTALPLNILVCFICLCNIDLLYCE